MKLFVVFTLYYWNCFSLKEKFVAGKASSGVGQSDISDASEIIEIFDKKRKPKKRRKKGKNWTHRKRHGPSPATSEFSYKTFPLSRRGRTQNDTPLSDRSYISYYTRDKTESSMKTAEKNRNTGTKTRSVSREQERETRYHEQLEHMKLYCTERDCPLYFDDVDVLNEHKIMDHDVLALHYCEECCKRYTTA